MSERRAFDIKQLGWIRQNRRVPSHTVELAVVARRALEQVSRAVPEKPSSEVWQVIMAMVDDDFVSHCSIEAVRHGTLMIRVDDSRLVYSYRIRWSWELREQIRRACPNAHINDVRFVGLTVK